MIFMSIELNNNFNGMPITYEGNQKSSVCQFNNDGTVGFDRTLMGTKPATLPSFVGKVYTEEELYQYVDDKVQQNQCNKKSLADMIKDSCIGWSTASFKFVGESKTYTYYDFIQELEKRSEHKL
jgi:hypothetical protein